MLSKEMIYLPSSSEPWKHPRTAWRYLRLVEVVAPGSVGNSLVKETTEAQYKEINEFSLSEPSKSWAAFRNAPTTYPRQKRKC